MSRQRLIIGLTEQATVEQSAAIADGLREQFPDLEVTVISGCTAIAVLPGEEPCP